ncbi:hypothetical protein [Streptomyces sp. NPDC092903]|uniref:hypothetical protein n=1 Tax=Streptomyces sp. NPDC092903 TaxID=3366017 RepID=UPI0037F35DAC
MDTQPPEPGADDMVAAQQLIQLALEALDDDFPEAARAFAGLAQVHIRFGLRADKLGPEPEAEPSADLPPPRSSQDWDQPGLPADCAPGRAPGLLTDAQAHARMDYGLAQGWTQRRTGAFAGRSATVVNRKKTGKKK